MSNETLSQTPAQASQSGSAGTEALLFKDDPQFWFEIERLFGAAEYGGALFGEVIAIARQIKSGDYDGWYDAMSGAADRLADEAASQLKRGHGISARDNYLRACSYYRSAEFFLHANPADPRVKRAFERSTASYRQAAALFSPVIEPVEIPFEGTTLTGYFHHADTTGEPRKTLLLCSGFDGSPEEMHWNGGRAAVERGYNVLVFDGPGQYATVHRQGLLFPAQLGERRHAGRRLCADPQGGRPEAHRASLPKPRRLSRAARSGVRAPPGRVHLRRRRL